MFMILFPDEKPPCLQRTEASSSHTNGMGIVSVEQQTTADKIKSFMDRILLKNIMEWVLLDVFKINPSRLIVKLFVDRDKIEDREKTISDEVKDGANKAIMVSINKQWESGNNDYAKMDKPQLEKWKAFLEAQVNQPSTRTLAGELNSDKKLFEQTRMRNDLVEINKQIKEKERLEMMIQQTLRIPSQNTDSNTLMRATSSLRSVDNQNTSHVSSDAKSNADLGTHLSPESPSKRLEQYQHQLERVIEKDIELQAKKSELQKTIENLQNGLSYNSADQKKLKELRRDLATNSSDIDVNKRQQERLETQINFVKIINPSLNSSTDIR